MVLNLSDTFNPHPSLASEVVDGELVLLHLDDGIYYGLDVMGTQTWQRLASGQTLGAVIADCVRQFPAQSPEKISADLHALAQSLVTSRLLVPKSAR